MHPSYETHGLGSYGFVVEASTAPEQAGEVLDEIAGHQRAAREQGATVRPRWPMIVLRTPKGWTGPKEVDGVPVEGTWRSHQVPLSAARDDEAHLAALREWMLSYRPGELFDTGGAPVASIVDWLPAGELRMGASPYANGGAAPRETIVLTPGDTSDVKDVDLLIGETIGMKRDRRPWLRCEPRKGRITRARHNPGDPRTSQPQAHDPV